MQSATQTNEQLSQNVQFSALDGYQLYGTRYFTTTPAKANIVVAGATGVPHEFYRRFAEYMTQYGYQVFTFDYRGVGKSSPKSLKGFDMSYLDWGQYDLAGAIEYLSQEPLPLLMVGHSYGGHALGLLPNHEKLLACYTFGTGAGWHGYMPLKERFKVQVVWNIVFPPIVAMTGYLPWSKFNMGSDLPLNVYKQWRKWCKNPKYFFADPEQQHLIEQYASVKTPIYAVSALDDDWALPASCRAFMQHYRQAPVTYISLQPQDVSMKTIGHMGYFKKGAEQIWSKIRTTFDDLVQA